MQSPGTAPRGRCSRLSFMLTPLVLIDPVWIRPFYRSFFMVLDRHFLRALRLLRNFKLRRYSASMSTMLEAEPISILGGIASFGPSGTIPVPVFAAMLDTVAEIYRRLFRDQLPS